MSEINIAQFIDKLEIFDDQYLCGDCSFLDELNCLPICNLFPKDQYLNTNQCDCVIKCDKCKAAYQKAKFIKIKIDPLAEIEKLYNEYDGIVLDDGTTSSDIPEYLFEEWIKKIKGML